MFSSPKTLERRTGKKGTSRYDYLNELVAEFTATDSNEYQLQILANLANFAYDPINYEYLRRLNVNEIFLNTINNLPLSASESNVKKVGFAISGICNLCLDEKNKEYLLTQSNLVNGLKLILSSFKADETILMNAMTVLIFLNNDSLKSEIQSDLRLIDAIRNMRSSKNRSLLNLATVFLEDFDVVNK